MKITTAFFLLLAAANAGAGPAYPLKIASGGQRYLVDQHGAPFYMVGDAPQTIMVQVSTNDLETYLVDRAARGFNTLWVYPVDACDQTGAPNNYYGIPPFDGADFTAEDPTYWALVDYEFSRMAYYGMLVLADPGFVGLTPAGGYMNSYLNSSDATIYAYGNFLGNRYKNFTNIIWSLGGDADPNQPGLYSKLQDLAVAIHSNAPNQLITFEAARYINNGTQDAPLGGYSSMDAALIAFGSIPSWLSLNWDYDVFAYTQLGASNNYWRANALPALMGEDWYEIGHGLTPMQLREEAYWECLFGCNLGRICGNAAIWTMGGPKEGTNLTWQSQLGSPGSVAEEELGRLFQSREFWLLVPDVRNTVMTAGYQSGPNLAVDAKTSDNHTVIAYIPTQNTVTMAMNNISGSVANAWWFNPSNGVPAFIASYYTTGTKTFTPPDTNDWVLVLDDASQNYPPPGVGSVLGMDSLSIRLAGRRMYQLTVSGLPGQTYTFQFTTNVNGPWQTMGVGTANRSGTFSINVSAMPTDTFYRAVRSGD